MYGENENNQDYNQTTEGESFESNEHTEQAKEQVQDSTDVSQTAVESTYRNVYYNDNADFGSEAKQSYINGAIYEEPQKQKKSGKGKKTAKFIAKAAAFGLIAGAAFFGINAAGKFIYPSSEPEKKTVQLAVTTTNSGGKSSGATMALDVSDVVEEVMPSVVSVVSRLSSEITYGPFSLGKQEYDNSGIAGNPLLASPEKAEKIYERMTSLFAEFIKRIKPIHSDEQPCYRRCADNNRHLY